MLPILDGLVAAVDAGLTRACERNDESTATNFANAIGGLETARLALRRALDTTNGENDGQHNER